MYKPATPRKGRVKIVIFLNDLPVKKKRKSGMTAIKLKACSFESKAMKKNSMLRISEENPCLSVNRIRFSRAEERKRSISTSSLLLKLATASV